MKTTKNIISGYSISILACVPLFVLISLLLYCTTLQTPHSSGFLTRKKTFCYFFSFLPLFDFDFFLSHKLILINQRFLRFGGYFIVTCFMSLLKFFFFSLFSLLCFFFFFFFSNIRNAESCDSTIVVNELV